MTRVALVTAASARHLDADLPPLLAALDRAGARPDVVVWDDDDVEWGAYDLAVVRSTWDYSERREQFVQWARSLPCVLNPPAVIRWDATSARKGSPVRTLASSAFSTRARSSSRQGSDRSGARLTTLRRYVNLPG